MGLPAVLGTVLSPNLVALPGKRSRPQFDEDLLSELLEEVQEEVYDILGRLAGPRTYNMRPGIPHGTSGGIPRNRGWYHDMVENHYQVGPAAPGT